MIVRIMMKMNSKKATGVVTSPHLYLALGASQTLPNPVNSTTDNGTNNDDDDECDYHDSYTLLHLFSA